MFRHILLVAVTLASWNGAALACSCRGYDTLAEHWEVTDVVFEGEALRTVRQGDKNSSTLVTTFQVDRRHKADAPEIVSVVHTDGDVCCLCGMNFDAGQTYLIFAHQSSDGRLRTSSCSAPRGSLEDYLLSLAQEGADSAPDRSEPGNHKASAPCVDRASLTTPQ